MILFFNIIIASIILLGFIFSIQYYSGNNLLIYAQTAENEIIENTLQTIEKSATEDLSAINETPNNSTNSAIEKSNNNSNLNITESEIDFSKEDSITKIGGSNTNLVKIKQPAWINYTDNSRGFTIEQPSSWIGDNISKIENSNQNASFEYIVLPSSYDSYKVLTRISAIDDIVNYDSTYDERVLFEKPNMTKYIIDGENAGGYLYLEKNKDSLLNGNYIEKIITLHNGEEYRFKFEEKDVWMISSTEFEKIKLHMLNSIRWLD